MAVRLKERKADGYRRVAQLNEWRDCAYLVSHRHRQKEWMKERGACLKLLSALLLLRHFAKDGKRHPQSDAITVSLVSNEASAGCKVWHVVSSFGALDKAIEQGEHSISARDLYLCDRDHCEDGDPLPIFESGIESADIPTHWAAR